MTTSKVTSQRLAWVAVLAASLAGCAATDQQEYTACLTTFTAVGVGAGSAGGAGGAAMGGAAGGSLAAAVLCREPDEAVMSLEPPALAATATTRVAVLDSDGDGVDDGVDRCAGTPSGTEVDEIGCPVPLVFDSRQLNFAFDSATLPEGAAQVLAAAVAFIEEHAEAGFVIAGHTDSVGSDAYNRVLSLARASAVRDALVSQGVPATRLQVRGEGESQPVATNETESGRARNRRVEVSLQP